MKDFGGNWTEQKLDALIAYSKAYLKVFKNQSWAETVYFDGFAGSGSAKISTTDDNGLLQLVEESTPEEFNVYEGAARQIVKMEDANFDCHVLVDRDPANIQSLEKLRDESTHLHPNQIMIMNKDCNEAIHFLVDLMKKNRNRRSLVFLDPFGMQINWDSIESLKEVNYDKGGVDLWILVPTGVAINRLLPRDANNRVPGNEKKLEQYLGLPIEEIRDIFYRPGDEHWRERGQISLFDGFDDINIDEPLQKISKPIEKIMDIYRQQLKKVWKHVTEEPLVLKNTRNTPIFHFVFASNNQTAIRIAKDVIDKRR